MSAVANAAKAETLATAPSDRRPVHPLAELFPPMIDEEYSALVADIKANGLLTPITLYEGKVLDGVHRQKACIEANAEPQYVDFDGDDALKFVISANVARRHLNSGQRAMVAAKLANMRPGARTDLEPRPNLVEVSLGDAAEAMKVSRASVESAKKVQKDGTPELQAEVESGNRSVSNAAKIAKLPKSEQKKVIARQRERPRSSSKSKSMAHAKPLNSMAWSDATPENRKQFIDAIGWASLWAAMSEGMREAARKQFVRSAA